MDFLKILKKTKTYTCNYCKDNYKKNEIFEYFVYCDKCKIIIDLCYRSNIKKQPEKEKLKKMTEALLTEKKTLSTGHFKNCRDKIIEKLEDIKEKERSKEKNENMKLIKEIDKMEKKVIIKDPIDKANSILKALDTLENLGIIIPEIKIPGGYNIIFYCQDAFKCVHEPYYGKSKKNEIGTWSYTKVILKQED